MCKLTYSDSHIHPILFPLHFPSLPRRSAWCDTSSFILFRCDRGAATYSSLFSSFFLPKNEKKARKIRLFRCYIRWCEEEVRRREGIVKLPLLGRQLALINHSSQRRAAALQALLPFLSSAKSFLQKLQILVCTLIIHMLLPLDKFKYMKLHLVCFRKQNIRKIVNILPVIFGC